MAISDSLQGISVFVRVAETRSFTEAASRLGISPSGVSKAITRLEERLGVRLFHRTTRSLSLTDDGTAFYDRCRLVIEELQEAENAIAERRSRLRGKLRMQMPVGFGQRVVLPLMARFVDINPNVTFDTELSDRESNLADEGLDLVVRIGELRDTRLIARRLCSMRFITVASPRYLEQHGEPSTPEELESHRRLMFYFPQAHHYRAWHFDRDGKRVSRVLSGAININHPEALLAAAIAGAGITNVPTLIAYDAVRAGLLRVVLREYASLGPPVSVVYLQRRLLPPRVQAFVDFLATEIAPSPAWDALLL